MSYDLNPLPDSQRRAGIIDVALLFAGANVVTSTLITGGTLGTLGLSAPARIAAMFCGVLLGTLPIALLARLGPRTGLPSMVLLRRPFGRRGAEAISGLLVVTNFAWIALNNVVAASAIAHLLGGPRWGWSVAVGAVATVIALGGERAMARFDRVAVPLLALLGVLLTWKLLGAPLGATPAGETSATAVPVSFWIGLDLIVGYQISWSLMFADYTRHQSRPSQATWSVLLGLSITSFWLMAVGAAAGRQSGSADPTDMILGVGLPVAALGLVALSTITTNFVNLYLSGLAVRNLAPRLPAVPVVLGIGVIGTALGLSGHLLDGYAGFMGWLATLLLPIVAVALVHFFGGRSSREQTQVHVPALLAWVLGVATYQLTQAAPEALVGTLVGRWLLQELGGTLPTLAVTALTYALLTRSAPANPAGAADPECPPASTGRSARPASR